MALVPSLSSMAFLQGPVKSEFSPLDLEANPFVYSILQADSWRCSGDYSKHVISRPTGN